MQKGRVKTFGDKAITISAGNYIQYYALLESVDKLIIEHLKYPLPYLPVKFDVVNTKYSGSTYMGPRYYATNVELDLEF